MRHIPARLKRTVIQRAGNRCEYCHLSQDGQEATFHIDHIVPVAHGGKTVPENLALACVSCSLRKSARQTVQDPQSKAEVPIFNPRQDQWQEHFEWNGVIIIGLTATERATAEALNMNRTIILAIRREEILAGRHPIS